MECQYCKLDPEESIPISKKTNTILWQNINIRCLLQWLQKEHRYRVTHRIRSNITWKSKYQLLSYVWKKTEGDTTLKDDSKIYIAITIKNIIAIICFTILAIIFNKWWIVFFSALFINGIYTKEKEWFYGVNRFYITFINHRHYNRHNRCSISKFSNNMG